MAHSGGIIAAGLGKGRIRLCRKKRVSVSFYYIEGSDIRVQLSHCPSVCSTFCLSAIHIESIIKVCLSLLL